MGIALPKQPDTAISERQETTVRYGETVAAIDRSCDQRVFATSDAQLATARAKVGEHAMRFDATAQKLRDVEPSERLYYLGRSPLRFVPLTPKQARQLYTARELLRMDQSRPAPDAPSERKLDLFNFDSADEPR